MSLTVWHAVVREPSGHGFQPSTIVDRFKVHGIAQRTAQNEQPCVFEKSKTLERQNASSASLEKSGSFRLTTKEVGVRVAAVPIIRVVCAERVEVLDLVSIPLGKFLSNQPPAVAGLKILHYPVAV
ncbi:hypothetical protein [Burkholderia ubonensis]|uniref:hypothetical protein n=1 Tax=Burkholderia ubonensis TaxID=101571 RepID=UPI0012F91A02|nr:hypothetical protein [Burkholderia ubonensis]